MARLVTVAIPAQARYETRATTFDTTIDVG